MKNRKRIVFAVTNDLSYDQRMHRICTSLQQAGYDVELIGRKRSDSKLLENRPFQQQRLSCLFSKGFLFYAEYNIRLFFVLIFHRADIFGACDLDTALAVMLASKLKGKKSVFDAHEHFTEVPEVERRRFVKSVWHRIGRWTIPRFTVRYTVGEALAEVLKKEYNASFAVIRNLPKTGDIPVLPLSERDRLIVYQGALNEGRGLEQAIAAMKLLPHDFKLMLIGEGDLSVQLREQAKREGLNERVIFRGFESPENLRAITSKAMVGLNLLEARSRSYYYSLANKFFDYMHAGVPSINMRFPEYLQIIQEVPVGICIEELTSKAIADAVLLLIDNTEILRSMMETCVQARMMYVWENEEKRLIEMFKRQLNVER